MSQYNDLYIRMSLNDSGSIPRPATSGISPDVIPYGNEVVIDPQAFFSANFDEYVSKDLVIGQANNIYVRMINYYKKGQTGKVYLYYALTSQLNTPEAWTKNQIKTAAGDLYIEVSVNKNGEIGVTPEPFIWTPATPAPDGDSYNLIAQVTTKQNPNPIPTTIPAFTTYVSGNGGIGWEAPVLPPPVTKQVWSTTVPYSQGSVERVMDFTLNCSNITIGSTVELTSDNLTTVPPIVIAPTTVSTGPSFSVGIETKVPADFTANLTFILKNKGTQTQASGSYVRISVSYFETPPGGGPAKRITVMKAQTTN